MGGRVIKDKLFFFGNFREHARVFRNLRRDFRTSLLSVLIPRRTTRNRRASAATGSSIRKPELLPVDAQSGFELRRVRRQHRASTGNVNTDVTNQWAMGWDTVFTPRLTTASAWR